MQADTDCHGVSRPVTFGQGPTSAVTPRCTSAHIGARRDCCDITRPPRPAMLTATKESAMCRLPSPAAATPWFPPGKAIGPSPALRCRSRSAARQGGGIGRGRAALYWGVRLGLLVLAWPTPAAAAEPSPAAAAPVAVVAAVAASAPAGSASSAGPSSAARPLGWGAGWERRQSGSQLEAGSVQREAMRSGWGSGWGSAGSGRGHGRGR